MPEAAEHEATPDRRQLAQAVGPGSVPGQLALARPGHALGGLQKMAGNRAVARRVAEARALSFVGPSSRAVLSQPGPISRLIQRTPVVLTSDATYAKSGFVAWFAKNVKEAADRWGLPFDSTTVKLGKTGSAPNEKDAVLLTWNAAWGDRPETPEIPFGMEPIESKMAVTVVHGLPGWAKVSKENQGKLDNLLGGETNNLSKFARKYISDSLADIKTKTDVEQGKALEAALSAPTAKESVANDPITTAKSEYALEGPTEKKDYEFVGAKGDASVYKIKFKDGVEIELVAPKAPTPGFHNHSVSQTAEAASYLPKASRAVIKTILLNANTNPEDPTWAVKYNTPNFHSYMTAGVAGVVTIYPDADSKPLPDDNAVRTSMAHETGHTWSYKTWGTDKTKGRWTDWKAAMDKDGVAVSKYAMNDIAEDVAETVKVYIMTRGSKRCEEYRRIVPARFAMLDSDYK